jgi:glucokinase
MGKMMPFLACDIGGTKTDIAVFSAERGSFSPIAERSYQSKKYPDLESILHDFLSKEKKLQIRFASFDVAGPVVNGRATTTNLPWVVDAKLLGQSLNLSSVYVLNDLVATTYFIPYLATNDVYSLNEVEPEKAGTIGVVAPGTGLGEAFAVWDGARYHPYASEGGHSDFAPNSEVEIELLETLRKNWEHVSWERVCSGPGIRNIFNYFHNDPIFADEKASMDRETAELDDPTPYIVNRALNRQGSCSTCLATLNTFVEVLGSEAGNLALKVMATGGIYLGGGIPPRILSALKGGPFMKAFRQKGRLSPVISSIPVRVILNSRCALLGAAQYGLDSWREEGQKS